MDFYELGIDTRGKRSGRIKTFCPQCRQNRSNKADRSLSVNLDTGLYKCHYCEWKGCAKSKDDFKPLARTELKPKEYSKPKYRPTEPVIDERVSKWFSGRGISEDVLLRNRVEYRNHYISDEGKEVGCVCFPYFRDGELVNVKYRSGRKKFGVESGCELIFYGYDDIVTDEPLYIVEGEIDKLSLEMVGITNCVSVPNGAQNGEMPFLESASHLLEQINKFVISVDSDPKGKILQGELIRRLGVEKCYTVNWGQDCKDANDVLVKYGSKALADCLIDATPCPVSGIFIACDVIEETLDLYDNGLKPGVEPPHAELGRHYRIRQGEWTLVTGIPGSGKTRFVDWLVKCLALNHQWPIAICSPETQPIQRHIARLAALYCQQPFWDGPNSRMSREELLEAIAWVNDWFTFIMPTKDMRLKNILSLAKTSVFRRGIKGLVIDPWNMMEHQRAQWQSETEYISEALNWVQEFNQECGVHTWIVAHPTKMKELAGGGYPVPNPYDVMGSSHWRNKPYMCLSLWRDLSTEQAAKSDLVDVHVQKVKFEENGELGKVEMHFDKRTGEYW